MNTSDRTWRKSSYSSSGSGDCLEIATHPHTDTIHIRDSKNKQGPQLTLSPTAWAAFLTHAGK